MLVINYIYIHIHTYVCMYVHAHLYPFVCTCIHTQMQDIHTYEYVCRLSGQVFRSYCCLSKIPTNLEPILLAWETKLFARSNQVGAPENPNMAVADGVPAAREEQFQSRLSASIVTKQLAELRQESLWDPECQKPKHTTPMPEAV